MVEYTWIFLQTGKVKKKLTFVLMSGKIEKDRITDLNVAYQYEKGAIKSGHTFTNSIDSFLEGKLQRMDQRQFNEYIKP